MSREDFARSSQSHGVRSVNGSTGTRCTPAVASLSQLNFRSAGLNSIFGGSVQAGKDLFTRFTG